VGQVTEIHVKECISALNETDTSLIVLYLDDLSYKEIAAITGLSENHIAIKMKRIRKKLFDCITPKFN
jgi:RNA polymerase sigma factor (sigma-70 family)